MVVQFAGDPLLMGWALETLAGVPINVVPVPEGSVVGLLVGLLVAAGGIDPGREGQGMRFAGACHGLGGDLEKWDGEEPSP